VTLEACPDTRAPPQRRQRQRKQIAAVHDVAAKSPHERQRAEREGGELDQVRQQRDRSTVERRPVDRDALDEVDAGKAEEREGGRDAEVGKGVVDAQHGVGVGAPRMQQHHFQAPRRERLGHVHDLQRVGLFAGNARVGEEDQAHGGRPQIS